MTKTHSIQFKDNPEDNYEIIIGENLLQNAIERVKAISEKRIAIVTDGNVVEAGYLKKLDPKGKIPTFTVKPDKNRGVESKKNVIIYGEIIDFLDAEGFGKKDTLICLGGGVIGDMGGFVAGTYKRGGMTYIQVPTTTLSQADSSVGGKCAIDSLVSKNAAGCFYQPDLVIQDVTTLMSLDPRNFKSGLVEALKHGLILDRKFFSFLEENVEAILKKDLDLLTEISYNNVRLKGSVVQIDPKEKNYRRSLNFGHTIGHAIEIVSDFQLYHGEAVNFGIIAAFHISKNLGQLSAEEYNRAQDVLLGTWGLSCEIPDYVDKEIVMKRLANDKKAVDGVPYFVTIDEIGKLHVEDGQYAKPIPKDVLNNTMNYLFD